MLKSEITFQIKKLAGSRCKAYFNEESRTPIIGRFVILKDHEHLMERDLIRFVSDRNADQFAITGHDTFTRIYMVSRFSLIKPA